MANVISIRHFLSTSSSDQSGIFVFMHGVDLKLWLETYGNALMEEGALFDARNRAFHGKSGCVLSILLWTDEHDAASKLRGHRFDRFWSEGEMPRSVGEYVLQFCK